ncbi:Os02g0280400 [Oryza sativa Japonica Group]|uniref:Os02g0280400 protein n=1 Tax=Oryza sativa subsp. japonica TaxID=39947 RepID=A0A0N7KF36_ORYSJ|nr:hypothetical protein EE612_010437 [Oryza sativa]BAS78121.1 Os02g0280400 [Oryza sativa Japonica Group]
MSDYVFDFHFSVRDCIREGDEVCLLDCSVDVADAVDDVEQPPVVALGPGEGLLLAAEGRRRLRGVRRRGPELGRGARAPGQPHRLRLQRCSPSKKTYS